MGVDAEMKDNTHPQIKARLIQARKWDKYCDEILAKPETNGAVDRKGMDPAGPDLSPQVDNAWRRNRPDGCGTYSVEEKYSEPAITHPYKARQAKVLRDLSSYCEESESVRSVPRMDIRQELAKSTELSEAASMSSIPELPSLSHGPMSTIPELPSLTRRPRPVGFSYARRVGGPPRPVFLGQSSFLGAVPGDSDSGEWADETFKPIMPD